MSDLISRSELLKRLEEWNTSDETDNALYNFAFHRIIEQPTAYDIDKVVAELEETMQDLSVIEVFSHIDFDRTIQSGLDNFLKAYNSELLRIVKQCGVSDDVCEWKVKSNYYVTECSHDTDVMYGLKQDFKFCPYCSKKIKVVE